MEQKKTWIGYVTEKDFDTATRKQHNSAKCPYIRKLFNLKSDVKNAVLSISALGIYKAKINGADVSDGLFCPGYTDTHHTILYDEINVTKLLQKGDNAIGVVLGDGWYAGWISGVGRFVYGTYPLKLWFELKVTYIDGTEEIIMTDGTEKAGVGEIIKNDIYDGQTIDHREYKGDCSLVDFDDSDFEEVQTFTETAEMVKVETPMVKMHAPLYAETVFQTDTEIILDFKENVAGIMKLTASGNSGDEIIVKYAETMENGDIFTLNLRSAVVTDTYILSGNGEEEFLPEFTYHGYRYVKIVKPADVKIISAVTYPIYNDVKITGSFSCSNELINKIYEITERSIKSNTVSIPTDCPQRNERMGWTGDSQAFCDTAMFMLDYKEFYKKHVLDMVDSTKGREDGLVGAFVPYGFQYALLDSVVRAGFAAWSDAMVIVPYWHYVYYGDRTILTDNILAMKSHVDKCYAKSEDGIARVGTYGEHVSAYEQSDRTVFATLYGAYTSLLLSKVCKIIGDNDSEKYLALYEKMKGAFVKEFIDEDGKIKSDTMALYAEAFEFGIIDRELAKKNLIRKLDQFDNHCVCGMFGTRIILNVLSELGLQDRAFEMITKTDYPSWGYMIANGATSLWELWDSIVDGKMNLEKINMNSLNHYMLGGCSRWFYTNLLGIRPKEENAGFTKLVLAPEFPTKLEWAKGKYDSIKGEIEIEWKKDGEVIVYSVTAPETMPVEFNFINKVISEEKSKKQGKTTYSVKLAK